MLCVYLCPYASTITRDASVSRENGGQTDLGTRNACGTSLHALCLL